jgi:hypothetical protein
MFDRFRFCKTPDCGKRFEATNPHADCCSPRCRSRGTYLRNLAKKYLGEKATLKTITAYSIVKALLDKRIKRPKIELLTNMGVDFSALGPAIPFKPGDRNSVFLLGNLGLMMLDDTTMQIVKLTK